MQDVATDSTGSNSQSQPDRVVLEILQLGFPWPACSSNWTRPVIACRAPSSPSMHSVASLDCVPAGHPRWVLLSVSLGRATLSFSTSALPNCVASIIG
jgi:hypothetical protein